MERLIMRLAFFDFRKKATDTQILFAKKRKLIYLFICASVANPFKTQPDTTKIPQLPPSPKRHPHSDWFKFSDLDPSKCSLQTAKFYLQY
jgi:hypothetical protein